MRRHIARVAWSLPPAAGAAKLSHMRVLHLVSYYPPDRVGGVGEVVAHLHRDLLERGHQSRVLTTGTSKGEESIRRVGTSPTTYLLSSLAGINEIRHADVLHAQHGEALLLLLLARLRRRRPAIVVTFHSSNRRFGASFRPFTVDGRRITSGVGGAIQRFVKSPIRALLDQVAIRIADEVTFVSRSCAADLAPARRSRWNIIHNSLPDPPAVTHAVPAASLLYVGRPTHLKRVAALPYILQQVRARRAGATLRIVGFDRTTAPAVADEFDRRGLADAVVWEGSVASTEIRPFYAAATLLLLPSAHEGLPMVILEAAAAGTPAVATAVGGMDEAIVDGTTGLLAPHEGWDDLAVACAELLGDRQRTNEMGRAARERIARDFGIRSQVDAYLDVYEQAANGNTS